MRSAWSAIVVFACVAAACRDPTPGPRYLRLGGAAPPLVDAPQAQALLVVFWATWCPPCRAETPVLRALANDPPPGLRVVTVSQDAAWRDIEAFFGGVPDPALHLRLDPGKGTSDAYGIGALPASILIVNGELAARFEGTQAWSSAAMRRLLERLMREHETHS